MTGQKTELPTHIKTFFDGKSFGDLSIEKKTLTGVWEVFRGSKKTWTTLYITKKGNSLVGEAYFFDDFTNIGDEIVLKADNNTPHNPSPYWPLPCKGCCVSQIHIIFFIQNLTTSILQTFAQFNL